MLDMMERNNACVGRSHPIGDNGLWLDGPTLNNEFVSQDNQFSQHRMLLAKHLCVFKNRGPITYVVSDSGDDNEGGNNDNSYDYN
jgi:hypothetical protein